MAFEHTTAMANVDRMGYPFPTSVCKHCLRPMVNESNDQFPTEAVAVVVVVVFGLNGGGGCWM